MKMDCNLKKNWPILCILRKSLKTDYSLLFLGEIITYFPPAALSNSDFTLKEGFFVKYLSCFGQHTVKSP